MGVVFILMGVMLLLTAISQVFWDNEYGWAKLILGVVVEGVRFLAIIIIACVVLVLVALTLITHGREPPD